MRNALRIAFNQSETQIKWELAANVAAVPSGAVAVAVAKLPLHTACCRLILLNFHAALPIIQQWQQ